ncbi:MAG TPA: hypothetical protein VK829_19095 [Terriglobales bacterium]|nr:hypothetical protein [Terriglobales bacterium]
MPRNAAVRFGSTDTQAIVRSANHRKQPRKTTKARGSYLSKPKILRIQQRYLNGQNKSEIAREEKCDRETVTRIVQFPEVQNYIAHAQQEFFGLIPDAMAAVRHALRVDKNPMLGLAILERTGVTAYRGERMQLPETTPSESGYERQARLVAHVLLEARDRMGVELPPEAEEALAKDAQKSSEAAKASGAKLSRR